MDEKLPEIGMDLHFLAPDVRTEFIRLFKQCLTSRRYGMEQRMDHGRDLQTLRTFMKDRSVPDLGFNFDVACSWLEYEPDDARRRIARTQMWDRIRDYLDSNGSSAPMPIIESHIDALWHLKPEWRAPAWAQFIETSHGRIPITAANIRAFTEGWLPPELVANTVSVKVEDKPNEPDFSDTEEKQEPEISQDEVPRGTKDAIAADVPPKSPPLTQTTGQGPLFEHPEKVKKAIEKIALACGGDTPERRAEWRAVLSDPVKVHFQDLLEWAEFNAEDIRRIGSLTTGNLHHGLRTSIRIVKGVIDSRTTLNFLVNRCRADGGRLEHVYGPYKIVITYYKDKDYEATV